MKHLLLVKIIFVIISSGLLNLPKYCPVHHTMDFCYQEQIGIHGGLGDEDH